MTIKQHELSELATTTARQLAQIESDPAQWAKWVDETLLQAIAQETSDRQARQFRQALAKLIGGE